MSSVCLSLACGRARTCMCVLACVCTYFRSHIHSARRAPRPNSLTVPICSTDGKSQGRTISFRVGRTRREWVLSLMPLAEARSQQSQFFGHRTDQATFELWQSYAVVACASVYPAQGYVLRKGVLRKAIRLEEAELSKIRL